MGSTDTLQGLQEKASGEFKPERGVDDRSNSTGSSDVRTVGAQQSNAKAPEITAEARDLFSKEKTLPLMVSFCAADPEYHAAVLAWAGALMDMGLKVSIDTTHGPHPITGEHMPIIRGEAYPNVQ